MPNTREFHRSFAGGELSPHMYGRIDDTKYQSGAALMRNFIAMPQGPAVNRPGTMLVRETKSSGKARLIPFTYSLSQTMVIELGVGYIRLHTNGSTLLNTGATAIAAGGTGVAGNVYSYGGSVYYCKTSVTLGAGVGPDSSAAFYLQPSTAFEIPTTYTEAELFDVHSVQSGDIVTLVHPSHKPAELRRYGSLQWTLTDIAFGSVISAPTISSITTSRGEIQVISAATTASPAVFTTPTVHNLIVGDSVFISGVTGSGGYTLADGFYVINAIPTTSSFNLRTYDTGTAVNITAGAYTGSGKVQYGTKIYDYVNTYVVTAIKSGESESAASSSSSATNNLYVNGAYNTINWSAIAGATRYRVYKQKSGLYGYIGETPNTSFTDNNIAPDLGASPPNYDTVFATANNYPGAVSYYEQRRVFAGTNNDPQTLWMTKSGTESDMSYSIPTQDDDRIYVRVAAREANTIRHIVPLTQLLLLTNSAEWRCSPSNSDVITPSTISVRPQSYVGANTVQPALVNNTVVYCSSRGGHVRELGYNWQAQGFITGDLSLRASHLFDNYDLTDMCFVKSPQQVLWFVSNTGKLLGLTYIPEEQIGAWHQHDTDGVFESCAAVSEGAEDALYVVVNRTINGNTKRYVERFATRQVSDVTLGVFTDCSLTYNGQNTTTTTVNLSSETNTYTSGSICYINASASIFVTTLLPEDDPETLIGTASDVNDAIIIPYNGVDYRCTIRQVINTTTAAVRLEQDVPAAITDIYGYTTTNWKFARDTVIGLSHLEGKTVSILADGAVMPQRVVSGGTVVLEHAASYVTVGLPYQSDLKTLPMVMQVDGFGQGRFKNVNKAWLRVYRSSGIFIGPDADNLTEAKQRSTELYGNPPALKSDEILIVMTPTWAAGGQVYVRQADPLPLTLVGLTTEVAIGG